MKNFRIENNNLIITIPLKTKRYNPFLDKETGKMDNIIGLYEDEYNNGLCYRLDMQYKGKEDQWTDYFYKLNGTKEEFKEMIKELGIDAVYLK